MQDPSDSTEIAEPEENGQSNTADSPGVGDPTLASNIGQRDALPRRCYARIEAGRKGESTGTRGTESSRSEATTCDAEDDSSPSTRIHTDSTYRAWSHTAVGMGNRQALQTERVSGFPA